MTKKEMAFRIIEMPTIEKIDGLIEKFDEDQRLNERTVETAFFSLDNNSLENIIIKVIVLNNRYSAGLNDNKPSEKTLERVKTINPNVIQVAKKIADFEMRGRFDSCKDISDVAKLINDFQSFPKPYSQPYSFITKYCSFRRPDIDIPIVDNYVRALLIVMNEKGGYYGEKITNSLLADYNEFLKVINVFSEEYAKGYSFKEIDKYLWQYGKDLFDDGFDIRNIL